MTQVRIGIVVTAPNTVLEADLRRHDAVRVSWHVSRLSDRPYDARDTADHAASVQALASDVPSAIARLADVDPALVVVGLSAAPFKAGVAGHRRWKAELERVAGPPVVTLADGVESALSHLNVQRVGLLTPLHPAANAPIASYLRELDAEVVSSIGLACPDTASMAMVSASRLHNAIDELDRPEVQAIVQIGTNLDFARIAVEAAERVGKPVIAANTAIARAALARVGL